MSPPSRSDAPFACPDLSADVRDTILASQTSVPPLRRQAPVRLRKTNSWLIQIGEKMRGKLLVVTITLLLVASSAAALHKRERSSSQSAMKTLAERLGYARDAKLLIVHADDLG